MKYKLICAIVALLALMVPAIVVMNAFKFSAFDKSFYRTEFSKNNVYSKVQNADNVSDNLLEYLRYGSGEIASESFSAKEKSHLVDVRILFQKFLLALKIIAILFLILLLILVYFSKEKSIFEFSKALMLGGALSAVSIAVFSASLLYFESAFVEFHRLFFSNLDWLLSPTDTLIKLYPEQFFYDMTARILIWSFAAGVVVFAAGLAGVLYFKKYSNHLVVKRERFK